jgi:hypothetical protein
MPQKKQISILHTLGRVNLGNSPTYGQITSILDPRIIRLGVRYKF